MMVLTILKKTLNPLKKLILYDLKTQQLTHNPEGTHL